MLPKKPITEFEIRAKRTEPFETLLDLQNAQAVADVCRECFDEGKIDWVEEFVVIALSTANKLVGFYKISSGGISGTVADPKVIFQFALLCNASAIILSHNHPSGRITPSVQDENLTKKIVAAGQMLDIRVLDHVIVTSESYYSFAEDGRM